MKDYSFTPIAVAKTCYKEKFGIPRQAGLAPSARAQLHMLAPFNDPVAVAELTQCSHIWLQFVFHRNKNNCWRPKVRPPRLGGNDAIGVFATRSPYRPNPIGLSVVCLDRIDCDGADVVLHVSGIDMLDETPILDIKPYVPYADCLPMATNSVAAAAPQWLAVFFDQPCHEFFQRYGSVAGQCAVQLKRLVVESLRQDPRPSYQKVDPSRIYGMTLEGLNLKWRYQTQDSALEIVVTELSPL